MVNFTTTTNSFGTNRFYRLTFPLPLLTHTLPLQAHLTGAKTLADEASFQSLQLSVTGLGGLDDASVVGDARPLQPVARLAQPLVVGLGGRVDDAQHKVGHHHQHHLLKHPRQHAASLQANNQRKSGTGDKGNRWDDMNEKINKNFQIH